MGKKFIYGEYIAGEESEISALVREVFNEFVAPCYSKEGVNEFLGYIEPARLVERLKAGEDFILTAKSGGKIVGVIDIKKYNHISLLYVDKKHHCCGIAKHLLQLAVEKCRKKDPKLAEITVNSSLYGVFIYEQMGFQLTAPEQEQNGIKYFPMSMKI